MQKKLKALGLVLMAFTLTTAVGVSVNTETASAKKVNAKTLKLKKKKLSIKTGEKKTLKIKKVTPKNATLTWKSSKKKIATVSKKGVVKGKKKGSTVITVSSGKLKAKCKVTVKQTYSIKSVKVINSKVVRVTLNKAKKNLKASDFAVKKGSSPAAKTLKSLSVASATASSKSKVYDLVLATDYDAKTDMNVINDEDYVQVKIKKLNGVKTLGTTYYAASVPENEYIGGKTGNVLNKNVYFNSSYKGYLSSVKVSGLPAGLSYERVGEHAVAIKGIPTAVANGAVATMTAKDEEGKSLSQKIYFYIGSDTQIVSYVPFEYRTFLANDNSSDTYSVYAFGGSGNYTVSLNNNTNKYISAYSSGYYDDEVPVAGGIHFDSYEYNEANVKQYLPAANYTVAYTVTDENNANIKADGSLAVTAVNGIKLTGKVTAADNTAIDDARVEAYFKDENNAYKYNNFSVYTADSDYTADNVQVQKGSYELTVFPSQSYNITASKSGAERGLVQYNPGNANKALNFALPLYKVVFTAAGINMVDTSFQIKGVDQNGYLSIESDYTYLKKGQYMVDTTTEAVSGTGFDQTKAEYKLSGSFTVNGNTTVNLTAAAVGTPEPAYTMTALTKDTEATVSSNSRYYYTFTPAASGKYVIQSDSDLMTVYQCAAPGSSESKGTLSSSNSYTSDVLELTAGTTYVFRFSDSGSVTVKDAPTVEE